MKVNWLRTFILLLIGLGCFYLFNYWNSREFWLHETAYGIHGIYTGQNQNKLFKLAELPAYLKSHKQYEGSAVEDLGNKFEFYFPFERKDTLLMLDKSINGFCVFYEPEKPPENWVKEDLGRIKSECFIDGKKIEVINPL